MTIDIAGSDRDGITRGTRAVVILPDLGSQRLREPEARLDEAVGLAAAIALDVVAGHVLKVRAPRPATLFGTGQVETIRQLIEDHDAELAVIDHAVGPIQQRNLEKALGAKVIDRTGLILEIFGERAATREGTLQVELAHLDYQQGRLVRSWTHLERQRGGFGFLGGPGETQIETDRRLIRERMAKIRRELSEVQRTRGLHRARRKRAPWPVVALVGYTNAGKSTLFNRLTGAEVRAEDLLFATLDPTMRAVELAGVGKVILSDTVGFVSDLPTQLVAAFRATLEEVTSADLIVHVRDIAHPDTDAQAADVAAVLDELGLGGVDGERPPLIEAWNKRDLLSPDVAAAADAEVLRRDDIVTLSALSGEGVDRLIAAIAETLSERSRIEHLTLPVSAGDRLAWLHRHGEVLAERMEEETGLIHVDVRLSTSDRGRFDRLEGSERSI